MLHLDSTRKIPEKRMKELVYSINALNRDKIPCTVANTFAAVYACYLFSNSKSTSIHELEEYIETYLPDNRKLFIKENLQGEYAFIPEIVSQFSDDEFLTYMTSLPVIENKGDSVNQTPESISKLATRILDIEKGDKVADFGSGYGTFLMHVARENNDIDCYGVEINTSAIEIARIRAELAKARISFEQRDMFSLNEEQKYNKILSNYPFKVRLSGMTAGQEFLKKACAFVPDIKKATSSDWLFNLLLLSHLEDDGKAVAVMTNGSTWNGIDENVRAFFIQNGYVETVIALPPRMFEAFSIPTTMIILSKGNQRIRMIDAQNLCRKGRRMNSFSNDNIETIVNLVNSDSEISKLVDIEEIQNNNYSLSPMRFLQQEISVPDGVEFGTLIKRITRGAQLKASDLDAMISKAPTNTRYMMLSNIQDGIVDSNLPYLKELDPRLEKYCIKNQSLLLSKNGAPFKIAVAEVKEGVNILGNGNLFIIELDEEQVNPYFLKAFFDSEMGQNAIKRIAVGATIPNVSLTELKKMIVPKPSLDVQGRVAEKYQAKLDEIKVLQLKIEKAKNALKDIFTEGE